MREVVNDRIGGLLVNADGYFISRREQLVALAASHRVPVVYAIRDFTASGGLMSYGSNVNDSLRLVGVYVGRIVKGEMVADLPVLQPVKFEFVINLKTAKVLGLEVPDRLLALADEVIE